MKNHLSKWFSNYAKQIGVCLVCLLTFLCILVASLFEIFEFVELRTLDIRALLFSPPKAKAISPNLELVTIDKESETDQELELGQWHTWPHSLLGSLIDALKYSPNSSIGILLWFIYEDTTDESLRMVIAESLNPVYLESTYKELRFPRKGIPEIRKDYWHDIPSGLEAVAKTTGIIEIPAGKDGFYRWAQMVVKDERDGQYKYSLAVRMLSNHLGLNRITLQNSFWSGHYILLTHHEASAERSKQDGTGARRQGGKKLKIPLDKQGRMLITFGGQDVKQFAQAHFVDILKSQPEQAVLMDIQPPIDNLAQRYRDKLLLVGMGLPNYEVRSLTPRGEMSDLLIYANVLNTLLNQSFISRLSKPANGMYLFLISMLASGLFIIAARRGKTSLLLLLGIGLFIFQVVFTITAFKLIGIWVDFVNPAIVIGICSIVTLVYLMYVNLRGYASTLATNFNKLTRTYHEDITPLQNLSGYTSECNKVLFCNGVTNSLGQIEAETQRLLDRLKTDYSNLTSANEDLQRISREQANFISVISHEFRSPIENLKLTLENLLGGVYGELPASSHKQMKELLEQSEKLGALFERILYIGRLEVGKIQPVFGRVMLPVVIYEVLEAFAAQASNQNIELKAEIPENFPAKIWADEDAIKHILENLVSNAIKFTDSGGTVTVELNDVSQEFIEIKVRDTGCGLSQDQIPLIFEKYYRAEEYKTKGTGLGLAIVKRLVERHHGEIEVESYKNVGSTFIVKLPKRGIGNAECGFKEGKEARRLND